MKLRRRPFEKRKSDLDEEMQAHLQMAIQERVERGEPPAEARAKAMREFGNVPLIQDVTHAIWRWNWLESLGRDLSYALRQLRKSPGFTVTAVLVLALGIGANTAIFTLMYSLLLRNLPVQQPDRLLQLQIGNKNDPAFSAFGYYFSGKFFDRFVNAQHVFSGVCGWNDDGMILLENGQPSNLTSADLTGGCFSMLGVRPLLGRLLTPSDDVAGGGSQGYAAVLSYAYWNAHFHRDPAVLGRKLTLKTALAGDKTAIVVGVLPPSFRGMEVGAGEALYLPSEFQGVQRHTTHAIDTLIFGRLRSGMGRERAQAQLNALSPAFWIASGLGRVPQKVRLDSAHAGYSGWGMEYRKALLLLQALVGLVLLASCAFLATLLSARLLARRHEIAVRSALGASRSRIVRPFFFESGLLALAGAGLGLLLSWWGTHFLIAFISGYETQASFDLHPDAEVLLFTAGISLGTALLFGVLPALRASRVDVATDIKEGSRSFTGRGRRGHLGNWLVTAQTAFSVLVVVTAALLASSLFHLLTQDSGFRLKGTVFVQTDLPYVVKDAAKDTVFVGTDFPYVVKDAAKVQTEMALYGTLLERLNHTPGIESASLDVYHALAGELYFTAFRSVLPNGEERIDRSSLNENWIAPGYFRTMGTDLVAGRDFAAFDKAGAPDVCIVNQSAARYFFPQGNALGGVLRTPAEVKPPEAFTVVGVVQDTKLRDLQTGKPRQVYLPYTQRTDFVPSMEFVLKTDDVAAAVRAMRDVLQGTDKSIHILESTSIQESVDSSLGKQRLTAYLSSFFAFLALLLNAIGLFGVLNYSVTRRTNEIGIRMALGASRSNIARMMVREALLLVVPGLVLGVLASIAGTRLLAGLLYEARPLDPLAFMLTIVALLLVAGIATCVPARRAARVDPMQALRAE